MLSENATEANAKVAERLFIERTLWPKLVRLSQKITQDLLPFWPGNYVAAFDDIRPTDVQARLEEIKTAYPVMSINEIRQRYYRLPATLWGQMPVGAQKQLTNEAPPSTNSSPDITPLTPSTKFVEPVPLTEDLLGGMADLDIAANAAKELDQWERFALKRLGKTQGRAFEVRHVPAEMAFELSACLLGASSPDDVQAAFAGARNQLILTENT